MLTELLILSIVIAVVAVAYIKILAFEPVLNWWFMFGLKFEKKWFYKPIWGCHLCFGGQLAFWTYLLNWISSGTDGKGVFSNVVFFFFPKYDLQDFSLFWMVFAVTMCIFFAFLIGKLYDAINK